MFEKTDKSQKLLHLKVEQFLFFKEKGVSLRSVYYSNRERIN
jgi:hypothetical protein